MIDEPEVFGIREAAAFLGAHEQTVRKLARRGAIPAYKLGKDWRFRREALVRWMDEQRPGQRGCSVLVVDDDERVGRMLVRIVGGLGCRARQAQDGRRGLELVAEEAPDLILLDLRMPDMNGPQFLEKLRKDHPVLPVIIVTGYPDGELMAAASRHAPLMVLPKPVEAKLVERSVLVALGRADEAVGA